MAHTLTTAQLCFKTYQNLTKLNTDTYYRYKHCDTPEIFIVSTCLGDLGIQFLQYKTVNTHTEIIQCLLTHIWEQSMSMIEVYMDTHTSFATSTHLVAYTAITNLLKETDV